MKAIALEMKHEHRSLSPLARVCFAIDAKLASCSQENSPLMPITQTSLCWPYPVAACLLRMKWCAHWAHPWMYLWSASLAFPVWGMPVERKRVRPALVGSYEALFHATQRLRFLLVWNENVVVAEHLWGPRLERAIGVIYRPETERRSHYFRARLTEQFDVVLHFEETRPVEPLELTAEWEAGDVPETFPFAV
jgi:hypothetical protein